MCGVECVCLYSISLEFQISTALCKWSGGKTVTNFKSPPEVPAERNLAL